MKRRYHLLGLPIALIVTAWFIWYMATSLQGHDLGAYATPRAAIGIVFAALFWSAGVPLMALAWQGMLAGLGVRRSWRELTSILGLTQFAKYIPGNVAQYLGRVGISMTRGIPARALIPTILLETLLIIAAAIFMGASAGTLSRFGFEVVRHHSSQLLLVAILVVLAASGLFAFRLAIPHLLQRFAPKYVSQNGLLPPRMSLVRAFVLYCALYMAVGIGLILLAHLLLPGVDHDNWLLIACFALAWVVGFVTPGAPAGLGIREGLLMLMLVPAYSSASAGILVIALRIATTLGDALFFAAGWLLLPKHEVEGSFSTSDHSSPNQSHCKH